MAKVNDVAAYILDSFSGPISTMKLQKLVYYSQAWHLAWDEAPMFEDEIEAWAAGPVVRSLYAQHRGGFIISELRSGKPKALAQTERETIDSVIETYGNMSGQQLSDLTHSELSLIHI